MTYPPQHQAGWGPAPAGDPVPPPAQAMPALPPPAQAMPGQPMPGQAVPALPPPAQPMPATDSGKRRWRKPLRVSLAVGMVAFLLAGIPVYSVSNAIRTGPGPSGCCIPRLKAASVVEALKSKGHECSDDQYGVSCELRIGRYGYETRVETSDDGLINDLSGKVSFPEGEAVGLNSISYLVWVASVPYAHDPQFMAEIKDWVTIQVQSGREVTANVGRYGCQLDASNPTTASVRILMVTL